MLYSIRMTEGKGDHDMNLKSPLSLASVVHSARLQAKLFYIYGWLRFG